MPYEEWATQLCSATLQRDNRPNINYTCTVMLTNDATMQTLNKQFRGFDKPTNVLAFSSEEAAFLGDIALGYETVVKEAFEQSKPFDHHVQHLLVHGFLHLLGYDHLSDAEAEAMETLEIAILADSGIPNPYESDHA